MYSFLIEEDLCENQKGSIKFLYAILVNLCLSSGDLFIFTVKVSAIYCYFL